MLALRHSEHLIIIIIIIISTERNEKSKEQYSGENKRKMARQEDAWTIPT